ncbi:MAG TPA: DUF4232 domain-containing protein [Actinomycetota bacterium]|nr:DUF4232 domain-containing protein [Actinomycetota bacterium]
MNEELRALLRAKANEVPSYDEVPRRLTRRVRRRIARNAVVLTATVAVIAGGAFTGVRALTTAGPAGIGPATTPSASPTPTPSATHSSPAPTSPTSPSPAACTASQLRAVGLLEGAAGSREGAIGVTNLSDRPCTLEGTPTIALFDENQQPIDSGVEFSSSPPGWVVDGSSEPRGWPVVTLAPGKGTASVRIRWSNWCPQGRPTPLWRMVLHGNGRLDEDAGTLDVYGLDAAEAPPCNGPGQPSTIEVGPFEPGR